jgi:iron complex transport system substrate-binding protein
MRLAPLALLVLASCSRVPEGPAAPVHPTIVSLNPCSDTVLAEVADPGQILALSHYSSNPSSSSMDVEVARRFPTVSGTVEEVLALRPDVVITSTFVPPATADAFRKLGLPLVQVPIAASVAESKAQVTQIARLAGHPQRGEALNRRIDAALMAAAAPPGSVPVTTVIWQSGGIVPGQNTLITDLLHRVGLASFSAAKGMGQADLLPLETMLADPPQLILASGDPRANEDRMLSHPALAALKETRRERLDPSLLWCGGPAIIPAAERLAEVRRGMS